MNHRALFPARRIGLRFHLMVNRALIVYYRLRVAFVLRRYKVKCRKARAAKAALASRVNSGDLSGWGRLPIRARPQRRIAK